MNVCCRGRLAACVLALLGLGSGCREEPAALVTPPPPAVSVSTPVVRAVAPFEVFPGRLDAVESVDIRARVSGYLVKIAFQPGALVQQGDLLFAIDPRPYDAALARAEAEVARWQAELKKAAADLARSEKLRPTGAVTQEEYEQNVALRGMAEASLRAAQATVETARLDRGFTEIHAPIAGRISRALITEGNLVTADTTLLTTLVSDNPIHCYFDVDERTVLRIRALIAAGKLASARDRRRPLGMMLADQQEFVQQGYIDFVDNRVDPTTGTIRVRGIFDNPDGLMSPGFFTRIKVLLGEPEDRLLVSERALGTELGQKYVLVVNAQDTVEMRPVTVGAVDGELRVIEQGLAAGDRVVVVGLQRVRPGMKVAAQTVPMPSAGTAAPLTAEAAPSATASPAATQAPVAGEGPR
ncbi:MAG: efflux RND transporter periplasmic adaptor subunit [Pirellulales bacterium]|nr:efflux RND transporter periplasmic adaptor subunit [Pirellulales bacterium]